MYRSHHVAEYDGVGNGMLMKKTNVIIKVDSDLWKQLKGLAALKKMDYQKLLEEAIRDIIKKEAGKK